MKIYFAFSIRGGTRNDNLIKDIYNFLKEKGHSITTEFNLIPTYSESLFSDNDIFKRDIEALLNSDLLLADVNSPSLGVGFEIAFALCNKKRVIAFLEEGKILSAMINGNPEIILIRYKDLKDLKEKLNKYF
ncbi:MAG: nucleoside 2-deoxyribosyltransferase [Caldisericia bacterium]|nr:nucleoside 2-deoxyribosyltransferase [Caldisericia bacterium]